ncbi:hypothetical protein ACPA9J_35920 [Pseudomonas aeruginosa]
MPVVTPGLPTNLVTSLSNIFGYDIDFRPRSARRRRVRRDLRATQGQRQQVATGNILAARFVNRGKTYTAVRYTNKAGQYQLLPRRRLQHAQGIHPYAVWISPASARASPWAAATRS